MTESWDLCPSQELWAARGLHHHRKPVRTVGGLISTDGSDYALGVQTRSINPKDSVPFPILIRKEGVLNGGEGKKSFRGNSRKRNMQQFVSGDHCCKSAGRAQADSLCRRTSPDPQGAEDAPCSARPSPVSRCRYDVTLKRPAHGAIFSVRI